MSIYDPNPPRTTVEHYPGGFGTVEHLANGQRKVLDGPDAGKVFDAFNNEVKPWGSGS